MRILHTPVPLCTGVIDGVHHWGPACGLHVPRARARPQRRWRVARLRRQRRAHSAGCAGRAGRASRERGAVARTGAGMGSSAPQWRLPGAGLPPGAQHWCGATPYTLLSLMRCADNVHCDGPVKALVRVGPNYHPHVQAPCFPAVLIVHG